MTLAGERVEEAFLAAALDLAFGLGCSGGASAESTSPPKYLDLQTGHQTTHHTRRDHCALRHLPPRQQHSIHHDALEHRHATLLVIRVTHVAHDDVVKHRVAVHITGGVHHCGRIGPLLPRGPWLLRRARGREECIGGNVHPLRRAGRWWWSRLATCFVRRVVRRISGGLRRSFLGLLNTQPHTGVMAAACATARTMAQTFRGDLRGFFGVGAFTSCLGGRACVFTPDFTLLLPALSPAASTAEPTESRRRFVGVLRGDLRGDLRPLPLVFTSDDTKSSASESLLSITTSAKSRPPLGAGLALGVGTFGLAAGDRWRLALGFARDSGDAAGLAAFFLLFFFADGGAPFFGFVAEPGLGLAPKKDRISMVSVSKQQQHVLCAAQ